MPCSKFHHKIRNRNCKTAEKTAQIKFCIFESFCKNPSQELVLELKDRHQSIQREKNTSKTVDPTLKITTSYFTVFTKKMVIFDPKTHNSRSRKHL